jgi:hypothetical protein
VVVWPREAQFPTDTESKADYFDSIYHSACVVGLNSTAMLEAGLIGRPVLTILAPEFWESQEGTLHFRYLLEVGGGLLRVSRSLDEHLTHLADAVAGRDVEASERSRRFVEAFIRPHGLDHPVTPIFVDAVERLAADGARPPVGARASDALVRPALATILAVQGAPKRIRHESRRVVWKLKLERDRAVRAARRIG